MEVKENVKQLEEILFLQEVVSYLNLPSIPKREWDGVSAFARGVGVVTLMTGDKSYVVCAFDPLSGMLKPKIVKVFSQAPFKSLDAIYVVPEYMSMKEDVDIMDLDDDSKEAAKHLLEDAEEMENEGVEKFEDVVSSLSEWVFDEITNIEEARAWLKSYNKSHKIKGSLPKSEEMIKLRLLAIRSEMQEKGKK